MIISHLIGSSPEQTLCHPRSYPWRTLLDSTSPFFLYFSFLSLSVYFFHSELYSELDNPIVMENLCYSANKESEDAYDVSTSFTGCVDSRRVHSWELQWHMREHANVQPHWIEPERDCARNHEVDERNLGTRFQRHQFSQQESTQGPRTRKGRSHRLGQGRVPQADVNLELDDGERIERVADALRPYVPLFGGNRSDEVHSGVPCRSATTRLQRKQALVKALVTKGGILKRGIPPQGSAGASVASRLARIIF